ncbi:carbohydrate ABC transporter permease [Paenibacillus sp. BC26]|uniref:carbohydrate ABC transporter permease n=1 Tax=Paenibacillus sp. BC26 TaxID=1881032 RepID=UPI0008EFF35D|nr:carbohydrate ABC transporter permease [Paenibacillus sp. BC26]SFT06786.1 multiple sugar transport system permease protein/putative aldouronate transport system permease protein [Paenibacillus sp. BC26]
MKTLNPSKSSTGLSNIGFQIANYTILTLFMLLCIYPFYYIFIYSISGSQEAMTGITWFPKGFTLVSYSKVFEFDGILNATFISVSRTVLGTLLTTFLCSLFAYLMTIEQFPMRKFFYRFLVITLYFNAGLIPWYLLMKNLHLNDNFLLYIVPGAINVFYIILIKTYIEQLPKSLEESAKIDGAGYFTIYWKIIMPISTSILATIAVFTAVDQWNNWFDNYILVSDKNLQTLQYELYKYITQASSLSRQSGMEINRGGATAVYMTPQTVRMTITMVVTLPILCVYPFMQRYFVKGIMMGAIKG